MRSSLAVRLELLVLVVHAIDQNVPHMTDTLVDDGIINSAGKAACKNKWKYYKKNGGLCVYINPQPDYTYWSSSARCTAINAELIMIKDKTFSDWVSAQVEPSWNLYIGLRRKEDSTVWNWIDYSKLGAFSNWNRANVMHADVELCAAVYGFKEKKWGSNPCRLKRGYICQAPATDHCGTDNGGCEYNCTVEGFGNGKVRCGCLPNYKMNENGSCVTFDPCSEDNGGCVGQCRMVGPGQSRCQAKTPNDDGESIFNLIYLPLGICFLVVPLGTFVGVMIRRFKDQEEEDDSSDSDTSTRTDTESFDWNADTPSSLSISET